MERHPLPQAKQYRTSEPKATTTSAHTKANYTPPNYSLITKFPAEILATILSQVIDFSSLKNLRKIYTNSPHTRKGFLDNQTFFTLHGKYIDEASRQYLSLLEVTSSLPLEQQEYWGNHVERVYKEWIEVLGGVCGGFFEGEVWMGY